MGVFFVAAMLVLHNGLASPTKGRRAALLFPLIAGLIGAFYFVIAGFSDAENSVRANDRRCAAVQRDLLSARPRRSDAADLFQALGCRPRGEAPVYAPPTKRELMAGRPLPDGGANLP